MRRSSILSLFLVVVAACRKPAPQPDVDASAPRGAPSAAVTIAGAGVGGGVDGGRARKPPPPRPRRRVGVDAGPAIEPPPLPLASDSLEVVAIGKTWASRILSVQSLGDRVWLSARNLDAFAIGDGPLTKGPDIFEKLPYKQGVHKMEVVGAWPRLYTLRTKNVSGRMESPEPTLFVYRADEGTGPGTWIEAKPLGIDWFPNAFVAYRDGALIVTSQIEFGAGASYSPAMPATTLRFVAPDGTNADPKLGLEPTFMAWEASGDADGVSLLGTLGILPKEKDGIGRASGVHVVRVTKAGVKRTAVQSDRGQEIMQDLFFTKPRHRTEGTLVTAPLITYDENEWKPNQRTLFFVGDDGKSKSRTFSGNDSCGIMDAELAGDVVYGIRQCLGDDWKRDVVRVLPDGKSERLALPILVENGNGFRVATTAADKAKGIACAPAAIVVRVPDDVWVSAKCGSATEEWANATHIPILLRRGRPQPPVLLP